MLSQAFQVYTEMGLINAILDGLSVFFLRCCIFWVDDYNDDDADAQSLNSAFHIPADLLTIEVKLSRIWLNVWLILLVLEEVLEQDGTYLEG